MALEPFFFIIYLLSVGVGGTLDCAGKAMRLGKLSFLQILWLATVIKNRPVCRHGTSQQCSPRRQHHIGDKRVARLECLTNSINPSKGLNPQKALLNLCHLKT